VAFALGWQIAELYRSPHLRRPRERFEPRDLPGYTELSPSERTELGLDQIEAGINRLWARVASAGLARPDTSAIAARFGATPGSSSGALGDLRWAVVALHIELLQKLLAADFRLGKAYAVGRALADTSVWPAHEGATPREDFDHAFGSRLDGVRRWLSDLDSTLPPHAAKAVAISLDAWKKWAGEPKLGGEPLDWVAHGGDVALALQRQGQLWRTLLSGEKGGVDMLHADDYLRAAREVLSQAGHFAGGLLRHLWFVLVPAAAVVIVAVVVLATSDRTATDVAAVAGFLAAMGLTWQSVGTAAARVGDRLKDPLWGAALNAAIGEAITVLPQPRSAG
jgi:hypothetical protein